MKSKKTNNTHHFAIALLIVGVLLIFLLPIIFVLSPFREAFSDTGEIGDTIGGITTPFISLIGATLVYFSFREQIKANKIILRELNNNKKHKNFEYLTKEVDNFIFEKNEFVKQEGTTLTSVLTTYEGQIATYLEGMRTKNHSIQTTSMTNIFGTLERMYEEVTNMQKIVTILSEVQDKDIKLLKEQRSMLYRKVWKHLNFLSVYYIKVQIIKVEGIIKRIELFEDSPFKHKASIETKFVTGQLIILERRMGNLIDDILR